MALRTLKTVGMWLSWIIEDLILVSVLAVSAVLFLLRLVRCHLGHCFHRSFKHGFWEK